MKNSYNYPGFLVDTFLSYDEEKPYKEFISIMLGGAGGLDRIV
jgi:hypothetical protein